MTDDRKDRVSRLGQRFSERDSKSVETSPTPPSDQQPKSKKEEKRKRRTFYIDKLLITRLDQAFPKFSYEINPKIIEKSDFLELLLEYALDHLDDLKDKVE